MNIFQEGIKKGITFNTKRGVLSIQDLYTLKLTPLATIVRNLKKELTKDNDDELSFLDETKVVDKTATLRFEIAKAIYLDKKADKENAVNALSVKEHNQKVMDLIQKKKEDALANMSVEELEAMLK